MMQVRLIVRFYTGEDIFGKPLLKDVTYPIYPYATDDDIKEIGEALAALSAWDLSGTYKVSTMPIS